MLLAAHESGPSGASAAHCLSRDVYGHDTSIAALVSLVKIGETPSVCVPAGMRGARGASV